MASDCDIWNGTGTSSKTYLIKYLSIDCHAGFTKILCSFTFIELLDDDADRLSIVSVLSYRISTVQAQTCVFLWTYYSQERACLLTGPKYLSYPVSHWPMWKSQLLQTIVDFIEN